MKGPHNWGTLEGPKSWLPIPEVVGNYFLSIMYDTEIEHLKTLPCFARYKICI